MGDYYHELTDNQPKPTAEIIKILIDEKNIGKIKEITNPKK
jgi:hypothetical protein